MVAITILYGVCVESMYYGVCLHVKCKCNAFLNIKMSLTTTKSGKFTTSETKLNFIELAWENLMNECLISTKIFKNNKIDYIKCFDPNFVMDMRHSMLQQSSKTFFISDTLIYSEALKILRLDSYNRVLQKKKSKIIEKEIAKLKQILENHRLLTNKEINKITYKKIKSSSNIPKFAKYPKLSKRLAYYDIVYKVNGFFNKHIYMTTETENIQQKILVDTKALSKKNEQTKEISEPVFSHNNNIIEFEIENEKHILEIVEENNEVVKKIFESDLKKLKQELPNDVKEKFKIRKEIEVQKKINQKILKNAWKTWKAYIERLKNRRREKTIYTCKIESFLSYLQEKETKQEKKKCLKRVMSLKHETNTNTALENLIKIRGKQKSREEKEEKLKKLMQEVKSSQADTKKKLLEITKFKSKNEKKSSNHKFLQKIEKRRQERLKCRKEIQERKLKLKEEKEKVQIEKERERNQKEKQIRLEELKRKRRLEKEKKLKQKQNREKLRLNRNLAENHYKNYLLRSFGWRPWAVLLKVRDLQYQQAVAFYEKRVRQTTFRRWLTYVKEHLEIVTIHAENFYKSTLKEKCLLIWKKFLEKKKSQDQVATDWNEFRITERAFKKWFQFTQHEILEYLSKKEIVKLFYERKLKVKSLKKIRAYRGFCKMEEAKKIRKRMWRQKVKQILPDYQPVDISE